MKAFKRIAWVMTAIRVTLFRKRQNTQLHRSQIPNEVIRINNPTYCKHKTPNPVYLINNEKPIESHRT